MGEEKVDRRTWLKVAGGTVGGLVIGAAAGYLGKPAVPPAGVVTETVTKAAETVTKTVGVATPVPIVGKTVAERAINGVRALVESGRVPSDATVTVLVAAPLGPCHEATQVAWESATGIKLEVSTCPVGEIFEKIMLEATTRTGMYDCFHTKPFWMGDQIEAGVLADIGEWVGKYDPRMHGRPDGYTYPIDWQYTRWQGRYYALVTDNDTCTTSFRTDLLSDPKEQEGFEKQYGYPLANGREPGTPPETWDQYMDCAEWFYRPPDLYGVVESTLPVYYSLQHFLNRLQSTKWPFNYLFDEDMNPILDTPEGIAAAEYEVELSKFMAEGHTAFTAGDQRSLYAAGKAFEMYDYPGGWKVHMDPEMSKIIGKFTITLAPGHIVDTPEGKVNNRLTQSGGGWILAVSTYSKYPELAYLYNQFFCDPEYLTQESISIGSWIDPARYCQFVDPRQRESHGPWVDAGEVCTLRSMPFFNILGGNEYILHLAKHLTGMYEGEYTPAETMKLVQDKWQETTDRIGREEQKRQWKFVMEEYYPKH